MAKLFYSKKQSLWLWLGLILVFLGLSLGFSILVFKYWRQNQTLTSPISQLTKFKFIDTYKPPTKTKKIVYGFLPYWNLKRAKINPTLTDVAYFRLAINEAGEVMVSNDGKPEMGYSRLQSNQFLDIVNQLNRQKINLEIVFTLFQNSTAQKFFNSKKAQDTFFTNLDSVIQAYPVTGINLDVELNANSGSQLQQQFTQFIRKTKYHLERKNPDIKLSIDVYANAAKGDNIWNLSKLAKDVDYIVLMAYDFHRRGSAQAGPVAPLFGAGDIFAADIHSYLKETIKQVPPKKLLLGIPFYGYQWQTVDKSSQSKTYPNTGKTLFYNQVVELLNQPNVTRHWNAKALTPYLTFTKDDKNYIVYYDDKNSIHYKLELVNQLNLGGIAIWALGYEGGTEELWQKINQMISN